MIEIETHDEFTDEIKFRFGCEEIFLDSKPRRNLALSNEQYLVRCHEQKYINFFNNSCTINIENKKISEIIFVIKSNDENINKDDDLLVTGQFNIIGHTGYDITPLINKMNYYKLNTPYDKNIYIIPFNLFPDKDMISGFLSGIDTHTIKLNLGLKAQSGTIKLFYRYYCLTEYF